MDECFLVRTRRPNWRRENDAAQCGTLPWKFVCALLLALVCQSALAQAMYRIKSLGYLGGCTLSAPSVAGLSGADQIAGTACNAHGDWHAFLWRNDGKPMVDLGPDEVGSTSEGHAIN